MTNLTPGATVFYTVGGPSNVSSTHSFVATRVNFASAPLRIAWIGDLGYANAQAVDFLSQEALAGVYDHIVHVGDYAYDLFAQNGVVGDNFESMIEPMTSTVPYQGCEGNHEGGDGFGT